MQLCQVIDAAEFCRNVHADPDWRSAAEQVCMQLGSYVHDLNTNYALYTALSAALPKEHSKPSSQSNIATAAAAAAAAPLIQNNRLGGDQWDEETLLVGRMLKRDFERCRVHLNGCTRDRMAELVMKNQTIGYAFTQNLINPETCGELILTGKDALAVNKLRARERALFRPWDGGRISQKNSTNMTGALSGTLSGLVAPGTSWCR